MSKGRSIELFFHSGSPNGITTATIPFQWTGHVLLSRRIEVLEALSEPEANGPGVYILHGENDGRETVYIGETDDLSSRIRQHIRDESKDWWDRVLLVSAIGEPLNKAHSRYLESKIFQISKSIGKIDLANKTLPTQSLLSRAAQAHMEGFLDNLQLVLPALGFDFLLDNRVATTIEMKDQDENSPELFVTRNKSAGTTATGFSQSGSFIVRAGSNVRDEWKGTTTADSTYGRLWRKLAEQGIIGATDTGQSWVFHEEYRFNSVSAAAAVVHGRPTSGNVAWLKVDNEAISFGEHERLMLGDTE